MSFARFACLRRGPSFKLIFNRAEILGKPIDGLLNFPFQLVGIFCLQLVLGISFIRKRIAFRLGLRLVLALSLSLSAGLAAGDSAGRTFFCKRMGSSCCDAVATTHTKARQAQIGSRNASIESWPHPLFLLDLIGFSLPASLVERWVWSMDFSPHAWAKAHTPSPSYLAYLGTFFAAIHFAAIFAFAFCFLGARPVAEHQAVLGRRPVPEPSNR